MVKAIAYYLPQFHEIPENNKWWGEGFTEWTNLKSSKPLFKGHNQPNEPLNDNYYNLLEKRTIEWQVEIAKKYSVYAFNYYHYWFKGKKILEKPAENFLNWKDIDHKFMFMWANHDWTRSWVGEKELLLKCDYGEKKDWIEHIDYLMPFFKDSRYLKKKNRPMFQIYIPDNIPCYNEMISLWDDICVKNGFAGIYIINLYEFKNLNIIKESDRFNGIAIQEHSSALQYIRKHYLISTIVNAIKRRIKRIFFIVIKGEDISKRITYRIFSYDKIVKASLKIMRKFRSDKDIFYNVCTGWDNSPRYGDKGYITAGATPDKFRYYLKEAKKIAEIKNQEYILLSCWNEWCEGLVLEPTKKDGYGYLEAVKDVIGEIRE